MFDSELLFRDPAAAVDGDLTADEADLTILDFGPGGPGEIGHVVKIVVPEASGSSPTLDITFKAGNSSPPTDVKVTVPQIDAAGVYTSHIWGSERYWRMVTDVDGTTPDFGAVKAGVVMP